MSLATYFSPVATWTVSIALGVAIIPPMYQGFVVGGGSNLLEQARQEVAYLFSWAKPSAFRKPLEGGVVVTSPFGMRTHPKTGKYTMHNGKDYRCNVGQPVGAIADGVINFAGMAGHSGLLVAIDHADGMQSLYAHLSATESKPGAQVRAGDVVGACGNTGRSTGPHLHLGLKQHGQFIDPTTKGL
ncbi:M23 family metallopeptidase [Thiothrix winogradskyi]|uniref:M23 family metallopeptidase n=1 Tax=Thiothrix winogradskyi TaxID=96472 RepID=A0ABY3SXH1_9GAMM|nr:M23 family metallopeptidase [Thiothrix winogradskyi]UJS23513.1 M23 family metallopeptidase [Thiothrix winogradskyi]